MKPLNNRVIVIRKNSESTTETGIILTKTDPVDECEVIAVGPDVVEVNVSDVVIVGRNVGQVLKKDDQNFIVITEDDILAILEE